MKPARNLTFELAWLTCLTLAASPAFGRAKSKAYAPIPVYGLDADLLRFRLSQVSLFQSSGASFSGNVNWYPSFYVTDRFSIRPNLGLGPRFTQGTSFMAYEAGIAASYEVNHPLSFEIGLGMQAWTLPNSGPLPAGYHNLAYELGQGSERRLLHGIFLGYSALYHDSGDHWVHEIRVGAELMF